MSSQKSQNPETARYSRAVALGIDGLWEWDIPNDAYWFSESFMRVIGYSLEDFPEDREVLFGYIHPDDRETVNNAIDQHLNHGAPYEVEFRFKQPDNNFRWFKSRGDSLRDEHGNPTFLSGMIFDIQKQKQAEQAAALHLEQLEASQLRLRELNNQLDARVTERTGELESITDQLRIEIEQRKNAQQLYQDLYDNSPDMNLSINQKSGRVERCNQTAIDTLGYAHDQILGKSLIELCDRHSLPVIKKAFVEFEKSGKVVNARLFAKRADSSTIPVVLNASAVRDLDGNLISARAVLRDISDLHQVEQQLKSLNEQLEKRIVERTAELQASNRSLEEFAYAAAHDLKSPLRGIGHLMKWIVNDSNQTLTDESLDYFEQMKGRIGRMDRLLDDLLTYAGAGTVESPVLEIETADRIGEIFELLAPPPGFQLILETNLPRIQTRIAAFDLCFRNLIGNAIKHHDKDCGKITVSAQNQVLQNKDGEHFVRFIVQDDGPGIDSLFHQRVFKMFQTLKPRDEVEGSGLGLPLVKKTIEQAGGSIKLESSPGNGSRFAFTWPTNA